MSTSQLKRHNPALQATIWQGSKYLPKGYDLRLPAADLRQPLTEMIAALPADGVFNKQLPDMYHRVARGDTLSQIAATYGTRVSTLVALNGLSSGGPGAGRGNGCGGLRAGRNRGRRGSHRV